MAILPARLGAPRTTGGTRDRYRSNRKISAGRQGGLLTFGFLLALWSISAGMTAIIDTLNRAYDVQESRPWWKVRLTAIQGSSFWQAPR